SRRPCDRRPRPCPFCPFCPCPCPGPCLGSCPVLAGTRSARRERRPRTHLRARQARQPREPGQARQISRGHALTSSSSSSYGNQYHEYSLAARMLPSSAHPTDEIALALSLRFHCS